MIDGPDVPAIPASAKPPRSAVDAIAEAWTAWRRGELQGASAEWLLPYPMLEIRRPMRHWGRSLGLVPGVPSAPRPDYAHRMTTGHVDHRAALHAKAGRDRTNLDNHLDGRGRRSPTTLKRLEPLLWRVEDETARGRLRGLHSSATLPPELLLFELSEGFQARLFELRVASPHRAVDPTEPPWDPSWWQASGLDLASGAAAFADRLLTALAMRHHLRLYRGARSHSGADWPRVVALAQPQRHPVGHWLVGLREGAGARTWRGFAALRPFALARDDGANELRLAKWATGAEWLPQVRADELCAGMSTADADAAMQGLRDARRLDLVLEFLAAAHRGDAAPGRRELQHLLAERLVAIGRIAEAICEDLAPLFDEVQAKRYRARGTGG